MNDASHFLTNLVTFKAQSFILWVNRKDNIDENVLYKKNYGERKDEIASSVQVDRLIRYSRLLVTSVENLSENKNIKAKK